MRTISLMFAGLCLTACAVTSGGPNLHTYPTVGAERELFRADSDFAAATHARGIDGWMSFFDKDAIRIKYRGGMVKGYDAVRVTDTPLISDTTITLNWQPLEAHVFQDGALGMTVGTSQVVGRTGPRAGQTTYRGRYTTLWRRDASGKWKVIMDTGYPDAPAQ